jgi:hypothetical protein
VKLSRKDTCQLPKLEKVYRRRYVPLAIALLVASGLTGCSDHPDQNNPGSDRKDLESSRGALSQFVTAFQRNFTSLYISVEGTGKFTYCYKPAGGYNYFISLSMKDAYEAHSFRPDVIHRIIEYFNNQEWAVTETWGPNSLRDGNAWELVGRKDQLSSFVLNNPNKTSVAYIKITGECVKGPSGSSDAVGRTDRFPRIPYSGSPKATPAG